MRKFFLISLVIILAGFVFLYFWTKQTPREHQNGVQSAFQSFFPIGGETGEITIPPNAVDTNTQNNTEPGNISSNENRSGGINALSHTTVAGYAILPGINTTEPSDTIRYVSRENGFVYELKKGTAPLQISNIQIQNIYEASFAEGGKSVLLRFLKEDSRTIGTYYVPIPEPDKNGSRTQKNGNFLRDNIFSLVIFADGKKIASVTDEKGESIVRVSEPNGSKEQVFFKYPFKDWLLLASRLELFLQTKAHSSIPGSLFQLSKDNYQKIISGTNGLTAGISTSNQYIITSESTPTGFRSTIQNIKTGERKPIITPVLPEKCFWSREQVFICATPKEIPNDSFPESWYRGSVQFSDDIAIINPENGIVERKQISGSFDITQLQQGINPKSLYFIDKKSGLLYAVTI